MEANMRKYVYVNILNIVASILTCIILRRHMFIRGIMHFPMGTIGSILLFKSRIHGILFIYLLSVYQCMELYAHIKMYTIDYSWIDVEGYIIGFTYTTITYLYLNNDRYTIRLPESPSELNSL